MNLIKSLLSLALILTTSSATIGQQRRTPRTPRKPAAPSPQPTTTVTFDTLLAKETYKVYAEVRNVGQVIRSSSVNEVLEPIMKLAAPSREFKTLVKWLGVHAEDVMTSRLMIATWPTDSNVPSMIAALEFDSPEEARKFTQQLKEFLPKVLPASTPTPNPDEEQSRGFDFDLQSVKNQNHPFIYVISRKDSDSLRTEDASYLRANIGQVNQWLTSDNKVIIGTNAELNGPRLELLTSRFQVEDYSSRSNAKNKTQPGEEASLPNYQLQQVNSLILFSSSPLTMKNLRPRGSKLLTEDQSFRVARGRFVSEQVFVFFDVSEVMKEEQNRRKQTDTSEIEFSAETKITGVDTSSVPEESQKPVGNEVAPNAKPLPEVTAEATPDPFETALSEVATSFFAGEATWPDAFGFGISFENDSLDVKALMVSKPGEKSDLVPFFPNLIPSAPLVPESPSILPSDTELFAMLSLDMPQVYAAMTKPRVVGRPGHAVDHPLPFTEIEKRLKINIKDELLPLLGSEIVITMPVKMLEGGPLPASPAPSPSPDNPDNQSIKSESSFVVAVSVRDKEGMKVLLPKIVDFIGFKGASGFAQKESREDTEIVSYGSMLSYAFVGNFLVLSADNKAIRHVTDSYLKHETLASDAQFKNFTRWQPQQLQAQVYISPSLMKSYSSWVDQQSAILGDQLREFFSRMTLMAQPITYSLSSDGLGTLHELHIPKNLVMMAVAGISLESNPTPLVANERGAMTTLFVVASAENEYRKGKGGGSFGTLEQLQAAGLIGETTAEPTGYKINLSLMGSKFELTATPLEPGKTGKLSYFIDESNVLRGADHSGAMATVSDPPIN